MSDVQPPSTQEIAKQEAVNIADCSKESTLTITDILASRITGQPENAVLVAKHGQPGWAANSEQPMGYESAKVDDACRALPTVELAGILKQRTNEAGNQITDSLKQPGAVNPDADKASGIILPPGK
jgi:hypothetical protein